MIGTILANKYQIEAQLFAHKLGTAYRAKGPGGGESLLVFSLDRGVSPTAEQLAAIMDVSRGIRNANHPSLVPFIDWVKYGGATTCLVAPLPDSVTLEEFCKGGISVEEAVDVSAQLAQALAVASRTDLYHKDLSALSVMVSVPGQGGQVPRTVLWGLDSLLPPYTVGMKDDRFYGTPEYMAPELCSGKGWTPACDMYSLGILMYQMITGKPPFISSNFNTTLKRQVYEKPLPLHLLKRGNPNIAEFEKIAFKALQKIGPKRTESMLAMAEELRAFAAQHMPQMEFTQVPAITWPPVGAGSEAAPARASAPSAAGAEDSAEAGARTMIFSGISPLREPSPAVAVEKPQPVAEAAADTLRLEERDTQPALEQKVEEEPAPTAIFRPAVEAPAATQVIAAATEAAKEEAGKTMVFDSSLLKPGAAPAAAPAPAGAAPSDKPAAAPAGKKEDEDWFVQSPHELATREITENWGDKKPHSGLRFYAVVGGIGLAILVLVVFGARFMMSDKEEKPVERHINLQAQREAEKEEAAKKKAEAERIRKAEIEKKQEEDRKRDEELKKRVIEQAKIAAEKERIKKDQEAEKARMVEEQARLEAQKKVITAQQALVKFAEASAQYRLALDRKKGEWAKAGNKGRAAAVDTALAELAKLETMKAEIIVPESGKGIDAVMTQIEGLSTGFKAFATQADALIQESLTAPTPPAEVTPPVEKIETPPEVVEKKTEEKKVEEAKVEEKKTEEKKTEEKKTEEKKTEEKKTDAAKAAEHQKDGMKAMKDGRYGDAISLFNQAKAAGGNAAMLDKLISKAQDQIDAKKKAEEKKAEEKKVEEKKVEEKKVEEKKVEEKKVEEKKVEEKKVEGGKDEEKAAHLQKMGMKAMKSGNCALAVKYFDKAKAYSSNPGTLEKLIKKCEK